MTTKEIIDLYTKLESTGIKIWIDERWGVDALLEKQTREHEDLDIVVQKKDLSKFCMILKKQGYKNVEQTDTKLWNFVLEDDEKHKIDVHVIVFDSEKNGIYGLLKNGDIYPADSLLGKGKINNHDMRCISAEYVVKFHTGYKLRDSDFHDVLLLCERFNIEFPKEHKK